MKIVNKQTEQAYETALKSEEERHEQSMLDLQARKPEPLDLELHPEDAEPLEFQGLVVLPGCYYGEDQNGAPIIIHPDDIGPEETKHWEEAS